MTLIQRYICEEGWSQQLAFAKTGQVPAVSQAPHLTVDAALLLVDQHLVEEGSHVACSRAEVADAFAYLTNPLVGSAVWLDDRHDALVICAPPPS